MSPEEKAWRESPERAWLDEQYGSCEMRVGWRGDVNWRAILHGVGKYGLTMSEELPSREEAVRWLQALLKK